MNAEIITIGDEILIGQIVDTNSAWIASELNKIGIRVFEMRSVSDDFKHITETLNSINKSTNLIIITGGLGPTSDDITKHTLAQFFDTKLVRNTEVEKHVSEMMKKRGIKQLERNIQQADVPEKCKVIFNSAGTAPGMWFEKDGKIYISLPGIPYEMKTIMNEGVIPELKSRFNLKDIYHKTILTKGIPESMLAERLQDFEFELDKRIKLAYLPSPETVKLRFSAYDKDSDLIKQIIDKEVDKLKQIIPDNIFGEDEQTMQEIVGNMLKNRKYTLSTAESCTGGNIAKLITEIPGCSEYFKGSVVAYSNEIKNKVLGVQKTILSEYGAVSKEVVEEMATGVLKLMDTDYAVATSGIAGPEGGSDDKPVGTVWIAVASRNEVFSKKFVFTILRDINIRRASNNALEMLRLMISGKNPDTF